MNTVGVILLIVGIVGAIASIAMFGWGSGPRRHRTVIDDGNGNVVRREDTYQ